jgi:SAM-dependent methyltransferase
VGPPAGWVREQMSALPVGGRVLDVACGRGRHALFLAAAGFKVTAVDRDREALMLLRKLAAQGRMDVTTVEQDLEHGAAYLGTAEFDAVIVINYLHRPLFPALRRALVPGGVLVYETFTIAQAQHGRPRNPQYLLLPGELDALVAPLRVECRREGEFEGRRVASVLARHIE